MRGGLPACESRGHGKGAAAVRKEARVGGSGSLRHGRYQLTVDRGGTRVTTTLRVWQKLPLTWRGRWSGGRFLPPAGQRGVDSPELLCQPPGLTWSGSRGCARGTGAQLLCYTGGRVRGLEERWRPEASRAPPCWDPNSWWRIRSRFTDHRASVGEEGSPGGTRTLRGGQRSRSCACCCYHSNREPDVASSACDSPVLRPSRRRS